MSLITDKLSKEALLEQTAEECVELAQACLKMARKMRGENPTPKSMFGLVMDLNEELADVTLCITQLVDSGFISQESIDSVIMTKEKRWEERLETNK